MLLRLLRPVPQGWKNPEADRADTGLRSVTVSDALLEPTA